MADLTRNQPSVRPLFAYIDCVRGYAAAMVISCQPYEDGPETGNSSGGAP